MRIVMFGNFGISYTSEYHHALSLEALGHQVIRLQETTVHSDEVLFHALKADLLIWIHSHGFLVQGRPMNEVLDILKESNVPTMAYHLDLYMGLERWNEYENSDYFKVQYFFTVDKLMAEWLNEKTSTKGYYIPAGVLEEESYSLDLRKENDVIFVGSKGYHHEWPYRPQLIQWLQDTYGDRFKHYGGDGLGVMRGSELNRLYGRTKVVIGDTLCPGFNYPHYFSDRLFETIGRGGFLIFPKIKGLENYFDLENELITYNYGDFDDLKSKIDYYIENNHERKTIRERAFERVLREHTYTHRWEEILEYLFLPEQKRVSKFVTASKFYNEDV